MIYGSFIYGNESKGHCLVKLYSGSPYCLSILHRLLKQGPKDYGLSDFHSLFQTRSRLWKEFAT